MNASRVRRSVLVPLVIVFAVGCGNKVTAPPPQEPARQTPNVIAVTAPDSVAAGMTFEVVIHRYSSCQIDLPATAAWSGDSLVVTPTVIPQQNCYPSTGWHPYAYPACSQTPVNAPAAPAAAFDVVVKSAWGRSLKTRVTGGALPRARGYVQRIEVRRQDGAPVAGATIVAATAGPPFDTLATVTTGADGRAELVLDGSGPELRITEYVTTSGPGSEQFYQWFALKRDRPIRTVIIDRP